MCFANNLQKNIKFDNRKIFKNCDMLRLFLEIKILTKQNFNENQIRQRTFYIYFRYMHRK